jgi:acetyltransferase-like isoleucine patch superfamily enzyme
MRRLFSNTLILLSRSYSHILAFYYWVHPLFEIKHPLTVRIHGFIHLKPNRRPKQVLKIIVDKNCVIHSGVTVQGSGQLILSQGVVLNNNNYFIVNDKIEIGKNTALAQNVSCIDTNHRFDDVSIPFLDQGIISKAIILEEDVWVGRGSTILFGTTIGKGSIVAAGAVVTKSFPENCIIGGVPAKFIKNRNAE